MLILQGAMRQALCAHRSRGVDRFERRDCQTEMAKRSGGAFAFN
jgi:hypothetical protein